MIWGKSNCPIPELRHRRLPALFAKSLHKPLLLQPEQAGVRSRMRMCERGVVVEWRQPPVQKRRFQLVKVGLDGVVSNAEVLAGLRRVEDACKIAMDFYFAGGL